MSDSVINDVHGETTATNPGSAETGRAPLVELKNGKVIFKQKPKSFEKQSETLQEIVKFREMLEQRIERREPPLAYIPDEHKPLIAKLAHENDKTLAALSKHIRHELLPAQDEADGHAAGSSAHDTLPLIVVETAIGAILTRNNYGLDGISGGKAPAAVCVWRWEVKDKHRDWLPKNGREKAKSRLAERAQAKEDLMKIFEGLPQEEQNMILDPKGAGKLPTKSNLSDPSKPVDCTGDELKGSPHDSKKQQSKDEDEENDVQTEIGTTKTGQAKKTIDPEKAAKEKEKLEKRAAKAEKEKKEKDAQNKSRSLMANFFAKPKAPTRSPSKEVESTVAGPSRVMSEFEKSFKPFVLKKDTHLSPVNWFSESRKRKKGRSALGTYGDVIIIDNEDELSKEDNMAMEDAHINEHDFSEISVQDHLLLILSSLPASAAGPRRRSPPYKQSPHLKTYNPVAVRDMISKLSEAEIAGDISIVRSILSKLCDRTLLPAKVYIFAEDARPGYFGTWTRSSRIIGPRTPFARDVLAFDYGYDSGEEWEDETVGEADDVVDDGEDEDVDGDEVDSDLDSWLVDDEEEVEIPLEKRELSPPLIPTFAVQPTKRKPADDEKKLSKKRKVVVPLVPFARGPCWESTIGRCEQALFKPYRIQMFNDTPFPVDPFTFVSTCMEDIHGNTKAVTSNDGVFAVPSLPGRLTTSNSAVSGASFSTSPSTSTPAPGRAMKKPNATPKTPFPDVHLPLLLGKITTLQAVSVTFLVEAIHRELRVHKVKKNTIEAKVREVGEKCKVTKVWVVKPGIQLPPS